MPDIEVVSKASALDLVSLYKTRSDQEGGGGFLPIVRVTSATGNTVTMTKDNTTLTATENNGVWEFNVPSYGEWTITAVKPDQNQRVKTININAVKIYDVDCSTPLRYGYRISKTESDPYARVEYLYDAVGMTPAHMVFDTDTATCDTESDTSYFDYGSWQNVWFVKENKPLMLKSDGTVDYYLNPNDYSEKEDGTVSDINNSIYDGNAMAQIPLCWVYRYEDSNYLYEIVSNQQYDENYKAYAHTRANGTIADYFYRSLFAAGGSSSKLRSLGDQTLVNNLTISSLRSAAKANGSSWDLDTWSQRSLIDTLLVLMGKSTNPSAVFGKGHWPNSESDILSTGGLKNKGQFFGYNSNGKHSKVFHMEGYCGNLYKIVSGVWNVNGALYVKMTPEGSGYTSDGSTTGYTQVNVATGGAYVNQCSCNQFGLIPTRADGSSTTYWCSNFSKATTSITPLYAGFGFYINWNKDSTHWRFGGALTYV